MRVVSIVVVDWQGRVRCSSMRDSDTDFREIGVGSGRDINEQRSLTTTDCTTQRAEESASAKLRKPRDSMLTYPPSTLNSHSKSHSDLTRLSTSVFQRCISFRIRTDLHLFPSTGAVVRGQSDD